MKGCLSRAIDVARMKNIGINDFQETNLNKLVTETQNSFVKLFERDKIVFNFSPKAKDDKVICEPLLIKQVLNNLITNACTSLRKATHRVKELKIKTIRETGVLKIIVEDNGVGIDPVISQFIWRPFYSTKGKGLGTGLGLMICKRIVEDIHSGEINVESKHGYGAEFTITLPT